MGESSMRSKVGAILHDYHQVKMDPSALLSPQCTIVGDVKLAAQTSVFAGTQIRGDGEPIHIGRGSNIQENCCLHVSGGFPLHIGEDVTVGHGAILHGCTIENNVLIGMGAIVMDGARIQRDSFVGAGSLVTQGKTFPPRSLIFGSPARAVRSLTAEELETMVSLAAPDYREVAAAMLADGLMSHPSDEARIWPT